MKLLASYLLLGLALGVSASPAATVLTQSTGNFQSPNYPSNYPMNHKQRWAIQPSSPSRITIVFDANKQLENGYDFVYIYEVNAATAINALQTCNHGANAISGTVTRNVILNNESPNGIAYTFTSAASTTAVIVDFCTDVSLAYKGFKATYTTTTSTGGSTTTTEINEESGTIMSPNHPAAYSNNYAHRWVIAPKSGKSVTIKFDNTLQLESGYDTVTLYQTNSRKPITEMSLCGGVSHADVVKHEKVGQNGVAHTYTTTTGILIVDMCTDGSVTHAGFKATFTAGGTTPAPPAPTPAPPGNGECGTPAVRPTVPIANGAIVDPTLTRIVGGTAAVPHSLPWQVALMSGSHVFCGGTLISRSWVLTAAHCLQQDINQLLSGIRISLGMHDARDTSATARTLCRAVSIINHAQYDDNIMENDIALIKIECPGTLTLGGNIEPACLPAATDTFYSETEQVLTSGWGTLSESGSQPTILQQVIVSTMSIATCQTKYSASMITNKNICAAARNRDSCQGDSGGPLVAYRNNRYVIAGVVSWGAGCARPDKPGVYTHVPSFIAWINQQSNNLSN